MVIPVERHIDWRTEEWGNFLAQNSKTASPNMNIDVRRQRIEVAIVACPPVSSTNETGVRNN
jgi:hypothetical protein